MATVLHDHHAHRPFAPDAGVGDDTDDKRGPGGGQPGAPQHSVAMYGQGGPMHHHQPTGGYHMPPPHGGGPQHHQHQLPPPGQLGYSLPPVADGSQGVSDPNYYYSSATRSGAPNSLGAYTTTTGQDDRSGQGPAAQYPPPPPLAYRGSYDQRAMAYPQPIDVSGQPGGLPLTSPLVSVGASYPVGPTAPAGSAGPPPQMTSIFNSKLGLRTQKKHACSVCGKRFTRPSSLQTHMYSHTGEKPFKCDFEGCGRSFSVVSNLRRHKKIHGIYN